MADPSLGRAAVYRGMTPIMERRAVEAMEPDIRTRSGAHGKRYRGGGYGGASRGSADGGAAMATGAPDEAVDPVDERIAAKTKQLQEMNLDLDMRIAEAIADPAVAAAEGEVANKLAEIQKQQIGNLYQAAQLTAGPDGISTIAGKMWDDLRWAGGKTEGTVAQFYTDEKGEKRLRLMRRGGQLRRGMEGEYTNVGGEESLVPVELDGRPVDFSVDALERTYGAQSGDMMKYEATAVPALLVEAGVYPDLKTAYEAHKSGKFDKVGAAKTIAQMMAEEQRDRGIYPEDPGYRSTEQLYQEALKLVSQEAGMDEGGDGGQSEFESPEAVRAAYKAGKLTKEQARSELQKFVNQ